MTEQMTEQMIEHKWDLFISYAREDKAFCDKLITALKRYGYSAWIDDHIPGGAVYTSHIQSAIDASKQVIVVLSHASVASTWVEVEYTYALSQKKLVFPVLIDNSNVPMRLILIQQCSFVDGFDKGMRRLVWTIKHPESLDVSSTHARRPTTPSVLGSILWMPYFPPRVRLALLAAVALILVSIAVTLGVNYSTYQAQQLAFAHLASTGTARSIATTRAQLSALQTVTSAQTATANAGATATALILQPHNEPIPGPCSAFAAAWQASPANNTTCLSAATRLSTPTGAHSTLIFKGAYGALSPYYDTSIKLAHVRFNNDMYVSFSAAGKTTYNIALQYLAVTSNVSWYASTGQDVSQLVSSGSISGPVQSIGIACHQDATTFLVNGRKMASTLADGGCSDNVSIFISSSAPGSIDLSDFTVSPVA